MMSLPTYQYYNIEGQSSSQRRHLHEVQEDGEPIFNDSKSQDPYGLIPEMSRVKVSETAEVGISSLFKSIFMIKQTFSKKPSQSNQRKSLPAR